MKLTPAVFVFLLTSFAVGQTKLGNVFNLCSNADPNYTDAKGWTVLHQSDRFVIRTNPGENAGLSASQVTNILDRLEMSYDSLVGGFKFSNAHENPATNTAKCKMDIIISRPSGSIDWADGGGTLYGGTTGSGSSKRPIMWLPPSASTSTAVTHELTHGLQQMSGGFQADNPYGNFVGWIHESHANFMTNQVFNSVDGATEVYTRQAHLHMGYAHTRYNNWLFLEYFMDTKGMDFINYVWANAYRPNDSNRNSADPFSEIIRVHKMSSVEFGDMIGDFGMKNVIYDYRRKAQFRSAYNASGVAERHRRHRFTYLEALDSTGGANGRFVVPFAFAPQRYAYNIIRLYPDGSGSVRVRFRGDVQTKNNIQNYTKKAGYEPHANFLLDNPGSDWRYGLVAVTGDAASSSAGVTARYSGLKRASDGNPDLEMAMEAGEAQMYLVVAATPAADHKIKWDQYYYTIYRFPYMVEISGAKPEGFQPLSNPAGGPHANGGGFMASSATVAASAYVGPNARVTGGTVSGNARIEGRAVVRGGTVSGDAVVKDYALIAGGTVTGSAVVSDGAVVWDGQVSENARVHGSSFVYGSGTRVSGNAQVGGTSWHSEGVLSGTAQMLGDGRGALTASSGIFFSNADRSAADPEAANRTAVPAEVTAPRSMKWYGDETAPVAQKTPVIAKGAAPKFRFDNSGIFRYDLGGAVSGSLRIFDARGRLVRAIPLSGAQKSVSANINAASQMLLWKVDVGGKVVGQGRVSRSPYLPRIIPTHP
ncbi:MAG: DUF6055 domain-containing protein [Chitinispirillia bacterium]|nr:DUF6055 domain-containing protein [Chitinispirillia bacterium]MCL2242070.1 DUF6055 domain-containing protein [Chitinispirillia bacterium]